MRKALIPGTFDPITLGHLDVIQRSSVLFDEVIVVIMENSSKNVLFSKEERKAMIEKEVSKLSNVRVEIGSGLTIDMAKKLGACALVRGIRTVKDYEYEVPLATANKMLDASVETIFLLGKAEYSFVSSSMVKEIAYYHGDLHHFVSENVRKCLEEKYV